MLLPSSAESLLLASCEMKKHVLFVASWEAGVLVSCWNDEVMQLLSCRSLCLLWLRPGGVAVRTRRRGKRRAQKPANATSRAPTPPAPPMELTLQAAAQPADDVLATAAAALDEEGAAERCVAGATSPRRASGTADAADSSAWPADWGVAPPAASSAAIGVSRQDYDWHADELASLSQDVCANAGQERAARPVGEASQAPPAERKRPRRQRQRQQPPDSQPLPQAPSAHPVGEASQAPPAERKRPRRHRQQQQQPDSQLLPHAPPAHPVGEASQAPPAERKRPRRRQQQPSAQPTLRAQSGSHTLSEVNKACSTSTYDDALQAPSSRGSSAGHEGRRGMHEGSALAASSRGSSIVIDERLSMYEGSSRPPSRPASGSRAARSTQLPPLGLHAPVAHSPPRPGSVQQSASQRRQRPGTPAARSAATLEALGPQAYARSRATSPAHAPPQRLNTKLRLQRAAIAQQASRASIAGMEHGGRAHASDAQQQPESSLSSYDVPGDQVGAFQAELGQPPVSRPWTFNAMFSHSSQNRDEERAANDSASSGGAEQRTLTSSDSRASGASQGWAGVWTRVNGQSQADAVDTVGALPLPQSAANMEQNISNGSHSRDSHREHAAAARADHAAQSPAAAPGAGPLAALCAPLAVRSASGGFRDVSLLSSTSAALPSKPPTPRVQTDKGGTFLMQRSPPSRQATPLATPHGTDAVAAAHAAHLDLDNTINSLDIPPAQRVVSEAAGLLLLPELLGSQGIPVQDATAGSAKSQRLLFFTLQSSSRHAAEERSNRRQSSSNGNSSAAHQTLSQSLRWPSRTAVSFAGVLSGSRPSEAAASRDAAGSDPASPRPRRSSMFSRLLGSFAWIARSSRAAASGDGHAAGPTRPSVFKRWSLAQRAARGVGRVRESVAFFTVRGAAVRRSVTAPAQQAFRRMSAVLDVLANLTAQDERKAALTAEAQVRLRLRCPLHDYVYIK
jgi:hypothetical protein